MYATRETLAIQTGAVEALAERQREIETDLGGAAELSRVHRDAIRDLLRLELIGDFLFDRLVREGVLTTKGRQRAALSAYLATSDRIYRLRQIVGLKRVPAPVQSLEDALDEAEEDNA